MRTKLSKIAHILIILLIGATGVQTITSCSGDDGGGGGDPSSSSRGGGGTSSSSSSYSQARIECGTSSYPATYQDILYRCQDDVIETRCGKGWYDASNKDLRCQSNMIEFKCGTNNWYGGYNKNFRCQNDEIEFKCDTDWYNPLTQFCSGGSTLKDYGFITDSRDSKVYKTVEIGEQTWMAENLNYEAGDSDRCYKNSSGNCAKYGRLYEWETAIKACPSGWHLPSAAEWKVLLQFVDPSCRSEGRSCDNAGKPLKAISGWSNKNNGESGNGTDEFGFSAL